jgi:uncharacterized SAM-binding protein YcdF (DUF218 family)
VYVLGKILGFAFLPPGSLILLALLGFLLSLSRKPGKAGAWSKACFAAAALGFIACCLGPLSDLAILPLEDRYPALAPVDSLSKADFAGRSAIVVLGADATGRSPEEGGGSSPGTRSTRRISYAFRLSRRAGLPILFSGGQAYGPAEAEGEAQAVRRCLIQMGMEPGRIILEDKSRSTWENAAMSARVLEAAGLAPKVVLVSSAFQMPRAVESFRKNGIDALPAPADYLADRSPLRWTSWLPSADGFVKVQIALHEYAGILYYSLRPAAKR